MNAPGAQLEPNSHSSPTTSRPQPRRDAHPWRIVTGASSNHHRCLIHLLVSIRQHEPDVPVIVYDLGLDRRERTAIGSLADDVRRFSFEQYPPHVNIQINCGQYAWKPIIIDEVLHEHRGDVLWLDAGNLVHAPLTGIRRAIAGGAFSPLSSGTVAEWTHPATLARLQSPPEIRSRRNRNAAIVGLSGGADSAGRAVSRRWRTHALDRACIAPPGSSRSNHRYDQAILTVLLYALQPLYGYALPDRCAEITTHHDRRTDAEISEILRFGPTAASRPAGTRPCAASSTPLDPTCRRPIARTK